MPTNAENVVKIGPVIIEIFGICRFLPSRPKRCSCYVSNLWSYWTSRSYFIFTNDVATVLPLNIF